MVKINIRYIVASVILIVFLVVLIKKNKDNYYNYLTGPNEDDCLIKDGVMICKENKIFPSWFYPSYYGSYGSPYFGYGSPYFNRSHYSRGAYRRHRRHRRH